MRHARTPADGADGATEHALPGDGVSGGVPAAARGRAGLEVAQADPALELFLRLYCRRGAVAGGGAAFSEAAGSASVRVVRPETPIALPADRRPSGAVFCRDAIRSSRRASPGDGSCPRGRASPRSRALSRRPMRAPSPLAWSPTAPCRLADRAKHLASLYVDERRRRDPRRGSTRASSCRATPRSWPPAPPASIRWVAALEGPATLVDEITDAIGARAGWPPHRPDVVGISAPFPGNVYGAFRLARAIRAGTSGGAFGPGRRLRQHRAARLGEPRVFDSFDYVTLDDGERPLLSLLRAPRRRGDDGRRRCTGRSCAKNGSRGPQDRRRGPRRAAHGGPARRPTPGCRSTATSRCSRC